MPFAPSALTLKSEVVFAGRVFKVVVDRVRTPGEREVTLDIVRHPASVVLLPVPAPDRIILVRQYRYAIDRWIWELPAGSLDPGEDADTAARRECEEEVGLSPGRVDRLGAFFPTPGFCDEEMVFYRLTELREPTTPPTRDDDEDLEPRTFTLKEASDLLSTGAIVDMKTALGLGLLMSAMRS